MSRCFRWAGIALTTVVLACGGGGTEPGTPPPPPPPPAPPVASLTVSPDSATIAVGATLQLNATAKDAQGAVLTGPSITWSATPAGVASVSAAGLVTALQVGRVQIVAGSGGKSDTATVLVQPGSLAGSVTQTVGPAGASLDVPIVSGVHLSLQIPAGAVSNPVSLTVTPKHSIAAGSLVAVTLSPSSLSFQKPITLTLSLPVALGTSDAQHVALAWGTAGNPATLMLPTTSSNGLVFTTTAFLSSPLAAGSTAFRQHPVANDASGDPEIDAILASTEQKIAAFRAAAQQLEATLEFEAAIRYRLAAAVLLQGVVDKPAEATAELDAARSAACQKLELYDATAATRLGSDFRNLWAALKPVLSWTAAAEGVAVNATNCPERGRLHQVLTELVVGSSESVGFLQLYTNAMQRSSFTQNFEALASELYAALHARQYGSLLGLESAFADVKAQIQLPLAQRLRAGAYNWCVSDHDHTYLGTIFQWARDGGVLPLGLPIERLREVVDPSADLGYDAGALANDLQYCATSVNVVTTATDGSPPQEAGPVGGLGTPGSVATGAVIAAPPHGTLELWGTLMAFFCPNEAYGNDRIAVEFNGHAVRDLTQLTVTGTFLRSPVAFNVADLLTQGQVPPHGGGSFPFKLIRKSDRCGGQYLPPGDPPDQELIVLQLTYPNVTLSPASVTLNPGEHASFTATIEHSAQGVTWEVTGGSGLFSGNTLIYTAGSTGGSFKVTARSIADPERFASATVSINEVCSQSGAALRSPGSATTCAPPPVQITTAGLAAGTVGVAYDRGLVATGGDQQYVWSLSSGSLPPGLSLNGSTGHITGTPTTTGSFSFTVKVTSAGLEATKPLSILINPAAIPLFVYSGTQHISIVNQDNPVWFTAYPLNASTWCFVANQPTRLPAPVAGAATCQGGDFGSWTGTISGVTLNATRNFSNNPWTISGTIDVNAVSWSGQDPGLFGAVTSFSGTRITP